MTKIKIYVTIMFILVSCVFISEMYYSEKRHKENVIELEKQLQEKQETIETQVRMLIRLRDECSCEWLYDFYLEHAEEVGAYE